MCRHAAYTLEASGIYAQAGHELPYSFTSYLLGSNQNDKSFINKNFFTNFIEDSFPNEKSKALKTNELHSKADKEVHLLSEIASTPDLPSSLNIVPAKTTSHTIKDPDVRYQEENYGYDLMIQELSIQPHDRGVASQLNSSRGGKCGRPGTWRVGQKQDVTYSGGCALMGIRIPSLEREIMKNDMNRYGDLELFLGQTATWPYRGPIEETPRPTSWGPPLRQCRVVSVIDDNELLPIMGARVALGQASSIVPVYHMPLLIACVIVVLEILQN